MKDAYWFRHDSNARHDPSLLLLREKYGIAGYGAFWMLIEVLRESDEYRFPLKHLPALCLDFAWDLVVEMVQDCINEYDLLVDDGTFLWSPSLLKRMENYERTRLVRVEAGKKGGLAKAESMRKRSKSVANAKQTCSKSVPTRLEETRLEEKELYKSEIDTIITFFNQHTNSHVRLGTAALRAKIRARLVEKHTIDDCQRAIAYCNGEWEGTDYAKFIRISTIFGAEKFSGYVDAHYHMTEDEA